MDTENRPTGLKFNRQEWAGAFGDIGTDFPLIVGMILASGLDAASVLVMFGAMQVLTALRYRMPMPVQPLKAVAVLAIAQKLGGNVIFGAGLAIGVVMLVLTATRAIDWLARVIPKTVVRGIQFGLGVQLVQLALRDYVRADGMASYALAAIGFVIVVVLLGNRRFPAALALIALGAGYAVAFKWDAVTALPAVGLRLPQWHVPQWSDIVTGFLVLALPQIPLSLGNSILATRQIAQDFFPERNVTVRQIGWTYSLMNLVSPFFSGLPVCHGSGGMAGHYAFGGRTGGSVVIYGGLYLVLGLFFGGGFDKLAHIFPLPILGVILLFEGLTLMALVRDLSESKPDFVMALLVGLIAGGLPYGYVIALVVGTALVYASRSNWIRFGHE
jgi:MFS superfamily sulfate permease-like transporter